MATTLAQPPEGLISELTAEFVEGLRKSWGDWARAGMAQYFEQLQPPKCDAWQTGNCVGLVQTRSCPKGCGYVVHRCQKHGGPMMTGAIGGHTGKCRYGLPATPVDASDLQAKPFAQRRINAERMFRCKSCSGLVFEPELREHAVNHAPRRAAATEAEIRTLYTEPENPKDDNEEDES